MTVIILIKNTNGTPYANSPATLSSSYLPTPANLTTTANGEIFLGLGVPDGTYTFTVTVAGKAYNGSVTASGDNGSATVQLTNGGNNLWLWFGAMIGFAFVLTAIIVVANPQ